MISPERVLSLPLGEGARSQSGAVTVGGFLGALLDALWDEGDAFSGKRPLGDSSWRYDLEVSLVRGGLVEGVLDEYGYLESCDWDAADKMITNVIAHVFKEYK